MAIVAEGSIGTAEDGNDIVTTQDCFAGDLVVVYVAMDFTADPSLLSITDSAGNDYGNGQGGGTTGFFGRNISAVMFDEILEFDLPAGSTIPAGGSVSGAARFTGVEPGSKSGFGQGGGGITNAGPFCIGPSGALDLILGVAAADNNAPMGLGSSWTPVIAESWDNGAGRFRDLIGSYEIPGPGGNFCATVTVNDFTVAGIAFHGWAAAPEVPEGDGVDLVQDAKGWVYRSFKPEADSAEVHVERTTDAGVTWEGGAVPGAVNAAADAVPTLAVNQWDELMVFFHTEDRRLRRFISTDDGETWTGLTTLSDISYEYPRAVFLDQNHLCMVIWEEEGSLRILLSDDYGETWDPVETIPDVPRQLASLRLDRHGLLHLVYQAADDDVLWQLSKNDGESWTDPAQYGTATGDSPVMCPGPTYRGLLTVFEDTSLYVWSTRSDYAEPESRTFNETAYKAPQWLGTLVDAEDVYWICGREEGSDDLKTIQSYGTSFAEPV